MADPSLCSRLNSQRNYRHGHSTYTGDQMVVWIILNCKYFVISFTNARNVLIARDTSQALTCCLRHTRNLPTERDSNCRRFSFCKSCTIIDGVCLMHAMCEEKKTQETIVFLQDMTHVPLCFCHLTATRRQPCEDRQVVKTPEPQLLNATSHQPRFPLNPL